MATVYEANDTVLDVHRAIKVLAPALARSEKVRARFLAEARAMARVRHPNIVTVHDIGMENDAPYIVMELVSGGSVREYVERIGPLPYDVAASFIMGTLRGLQASHVHRVVHRDIKPDNMLLTSDGEVKLTDFGIAQIVNTNHFTRTGASMGTLAYMPPEQRVSAKGVDQTADLYAAGASLYAMVTGKEPFDLYNDGLHDRIFEAVPPPFRQLIVKSCKYEPLDRFASAQSMMRAVEAACEEMGLVLAERVKLENGPAKETRDPTDLPSAGTQYSDIEVTGPVPSQEIEREFLKPKFTNHDWFGADEEASAPPPIADGNSFLLDDDDDDPVFDRPRPNKTIMLASAVAAMAVVAIAGSMVLGEDPPSPAERPVVTADVPSAASPPPQMVDSPITPGEETSTSGSDLPTSSKPEAPAPKSAPVTEAAKKTVDIPSTATESSPVVRAKRAKAMRPRSAAAAKTSGEPKAAPTAEPATLSIRTVPQSAIFVDGSSVGFGVLRAHALSAGTHTIEFRTKDGRSHVRRIELEAGKRMNLCWDFDREGGAGDCRR